MRGDVAVYVAVGGDKHVVAYCHLAHDSRVYAYPYLVAYGRRACSLTAIFMTYKNALVNITVVSDNGVGVYRDVVGMSKIESLADI